MVNPKVSVMFLSYNHGAFIQRALDSVLNQTFQNFEIVLSDDCSSDNTSDVLSTYHDSRIKLHIFNSNQGATINHQYIWRHCSGDYLALINSDDIWLPEHLSKSVSYLDSHPKCGAVFSWASLIDEEDRIIDPCCDIFKQPNRTQAEWIYHLFRKGNCLCHPSMVIRRSVYEECGFYKLGFRQLPDYNLWTRMMNKFTIHIIDETLVQHRRLLKDGQNTSSPIKTNSIRDVNESLYTLIHYFDNMSDALFAEAFRKEFRNKNAKTRSELLCEKFFLMYDEKYYMYPISRFASFLFLHNIYDLDEIPVLLRNQYGFSLQDFHNLGSSIDLLNLQSGETLPNQTTMKTPWKQITQFIKNIWKG